jgi:hypothetical protein
MADRLACFGLNEKCKKDSLTALVTRMPQTGIDGIRPIKDNG